MTVYADLEIGLRRRAEGYDVDLRYSQANSDADTRLVHRSGDSMPTEFDRERLRELSSDPSAYGQLLGKNLLSDPEVRAAFDKARDGAHSRDASLRVRLLIDPSATELHSLHWETLRDPHDGTLLFTGENIAFSRYLSSFDWRPVRVRPKSELKALIVVANPSNLLEKYTLPPADVARELATVQENLGSIRSTPLASDGSANLNNIIAHLRDGYDILYVICHGMTSTESKTKGETVLLLENEDGSLARTIGNDIVARLNELEQRPRLIVLAACQGAGTGAEARTSDEGALAALGPRLAEAGIPAVIAMQGSVTVRTVGEFMPVFFRELQRDGQIDRAMAAARGAVRDRSDWWMPVLYMRLKSGRIWYVPGFGQGKEFSKWNALIAYVKDKACTPILGPGLIEPLLGSVGDIAQRWAEDFHYPLSPADKDSLPRIAQYLTIHQSPQFPYQQLQEFMRKYIESRFKDDLPAKLLDPMEEATLDDYIDAIGAKRRERHPEDAYQLLAQLPFRIYITTNWNSLLESALKEAGREPKVVLAPWNQYTEEKLRALDPGYEPSAKRPLVYYLFGRLAEPKSLVLTEDNYFDYLLGISRNNDLIPLYVRTALRTTSLLFIGFRMDEWNFRVLFRSILDKKTDMMNDCIHIAAQIEPEEGRIIDPAGARGYLEEYFKSSASINLYWGSAEEFVKELWKQWSALK